MTIYLDYVFFINFLFDFILLLGISMVLKRNVKIFKIILGALFGGISSFMLFLNISSFLFFLLKVFSGIIMVVITFNYKDIKYTSYNTLYLMIISIILGGSLYLLNISLGYEHHGMVFFTNGKSINTLILVILSFVLVLFYKKICLSYRASFYNRYKVKIFYKNKEYLLNGYLDTGNTLVDPYFNKPVFILKSDIFLVDKYFLVPFKTVSGDGLIKCFKSNIYIENIGLLKDAVIGIAPFKFDLSGVDIILNKKIMEDL